MDTIPIEHLWNMYEILYIYKIIYTKNMAKIALQKILWGPELEYSKSPVFHTYYKRRLIGAVLRMKPLKNKTKQKNIVSLYAWNDKDPSFPEVISTKYGPKILQPFNVIRKILQRGASL
jgi:tRNA A22 N-methylase